MSFGIGIGDVLLITKMGFTLWVNVSGAKEERKELMTNLMDWKEKLESIQPMLTDHAGMTPLDVKIANRKFEEAIVTLQVLEELNRKLVKGRAFRRAAWEVRGRATFQDYQMKLEKRLHELDNLSSSASMAVLHDEVQESRRLLQELTVHRRRDHVHRRQHVQGRWTGTEFELDLTEVEEVGSGQYSRTEEIED